MPIYTLCKVSYGGEVGVYAIYGEPIAASTDKNKLIDWAKSNGYDISSSWPNFGIKEVKAV
ncbi:hypothetical protein ACFYU8_29975 [Brevibacillus sp. NPDC003359]|uniref:hypothetical protein n=1 Tax=unclassified Brevibacillus TaxID=2684853 RepID=UPI003683A9D4